MRYINLIKMNLFKFIKNLSKINDDDVRDDDYDYETK